MTEPALRLPDDPEPQFTPPRRPGETDPPGSLISLIKLGVAIFIVMAASFAGQLATMRGLDPWYAKLAKPAFTPPNLVFPLVWTLLYSIMAWSFWRLLRRPPQQPGRGMAIAAFLVQLGLNVLWSWAFFGARNPLAGVFVVLALDVAIILMIVAIWKVDRAAAAVQVPYACWTLFATALTIAITTLN